MSVYCHNMNTSTPKEFISLPSGERENYSEVFGMRLLNPDICPSNVTRDTCPCVEDKSPRVGMTVWTKISINITALSINRKKQINNPNCFHSSFSFVTLASN